MRTYCEAIASAGAPLKVVFSFIDRTEIAICHPGPTYDDLDLQRVIYTSHKWMYYLSYLAVTAPDGLCIHFRAQWKVAAMIQQSFDPANYSVFLTAMKLFSMDASFMAILPTASSTARPRQPRHPPGPPGSPALGR